MKLSTDRILTTHVGSLPRPDDLFELMLSRMDGKPVVEMQITSVEFNASIDDELFHMPKK